MNDGMMEIYNALIKQKIMIDEQVQLKFYEVPESIDASRPFIVISPWEPIVPGYFAGNKEMSVKLSYQINVESTNRMLTKQIQFEVKKTMYALGFSQLGGGLDEYFTETKRFVDARRYRKNTKIHETNY